MRKKFLLFAIIALAGSVKLNAQSTWRFHLAFEDAIGAKDTLWFIFDSTATSGDDPQLGDTAYNNMNLNVFNVWFWNSSFDSTKTKANRFSSLSLGANIFAFNYQYPIIIKWDSALFNSSILPWPINTARLDNNWFFFNNNSPLDHQFDMLLDDSAYAPAFFYGTQSQFPLLFYMGYSSTINTMALENNSCIELEALSDKRIKLINRCRASENIQLQMIDLRGRVVVSKTINSNQTETIINCFHLKNSLYILKLSNSIINYHEKFILH